MNSLILNNINSKLSRKDTLYVVGDMFFCSNTPVSDILAEIKPKLVLIRGNHDRDWLRKLSKAEIEKRFVSVTDTLSLKKYGYELHLSHYPMLAWNRSQYFGSSFSICGHIHSRKDSPISAQLFPLVKGQFNCGVDINNFEPVTFSELVRNNIDFYGIEFTDDEKQRLDLAISSIMRD